mgnify:FL=1
MEKKLILSLATAFLGAMQVLAQNPVTEVNDVNTPLHLMKPAYTYGYGIPQESEVRSTMDRVLSYLDEATPSTAGQDNRIAPGKFRLTSYECGVTYAAMVRASEVTGDASFRNFASSRLSLVSGLASKYKEEKGKKPDYDPQLRSVLHPAALDDAGAMAAALIRLQLTGQKNPAYDTMIDRYVDWVKNKEFRLEDGTLARNRPHTNTVWLDDMYMGVPCLAWYGRYKNDPTYTDVAIRQIKLFKEKMWVPEHKLFRHGWVEAMQPHPAFHWGRANGWAILTMCEVLDAIPANHPDRPMVLDLLKQHIEGLAQLQDMTGLWHQLLDRPETYLETSCTAIYAYCIAHAINEGWVDALTYGAQVYLAWHAITANVNEQGQVMNTCVGTGMGFDPAFYAYRPVHVMAAHGYGPVIWAGAEVIKMLQSTYPKMNDSAVQFYRTEQKTDKPIFSEGETK